METVTIVLVATLLGISSTGLGTEKAVWPSRAESSAYIVRGKDAWTFVTENRSFRFAEVLGDKGGYEALLLLEETFHNERTDGGEGSRGSVTVKAWSVKQGGDREIRRTLKEIGNEGERQDGFCRVTAWGCCDSPVVYSYYNILTGRKLYVSNPDLLEVRGDRYGPQASRYVAFGYAGINELDRPPQLQFSTDKKAVQRFSIVSSREYYDAPKTFVSADEKVEHSLDLRGSPMNFTIVLRYQDGVELRVPVEADAIRPDKAELPKSYSLRAEE